jgi:putative ABC transport system permease protein
LNVAGDLRHGLRSIVRDFRHALGSIARMPGLAAVIIVSLGAGIGVNTVVFSWIQALVFKPLPGVSHGAAFHLLEAKTETGIYTGTSWLEYRDLRESLQTFQDPLAFRMIPLYIGETGRVERAYGLLVSGNYFSALGLRPARGRFFRPEEAMTPGTEPVVVISYDFWQERFGGVDDVLQRSLRVNGQQLAIVGVAPRGFQGTVLRLSFDVWLPATLAPTLLNGSREIDDRSSRGYQVISRLKPGVTRAQAQSEFDSAIRQFAKTYPQTNAGIGGDVLQFWEAPRGPQRFLLTALAILQGVMLLLLLAVCGNTANLVLARASSRQREVGIRVALGAAPWRVISLLLTENLVLGILGAALGAAIAIWGTQAMPNVRLSGLPVRLQTELDLSGLAFAMTLGILSGLTFGAAPAVQLARIDPLRALRDGARTASRSRVRNVLMGAQVALALVVLVVAGLFFRSFMETRDADTGFRRDGIMLAAYDLTGRIKAGDPGFPRTFADTLLNRLREIPALESIAISSSVPLDIHGLPSRTFTVDGHTRIEPGADDALFNIVTPGYFKTMDIGLAAGSDFADMKDTTSPPQAIVNHAFVTRYLSSADATVAIGRGLQMRNVRYTIVGVARDSIYNAFGERPTPIIYLSYRDRPTVAGEIHLRTRPGAEGTVMPEVRRIVREMDPELSIYNVRTLNDHIENNLLFRRIPAKMFSVLGPLLLILAAIGIYAVVAYTVSHRTSEIGVRLALGATARRVVTTFVGQSLAVVGFGAVAGWVLAFVVALAFTTDGAIDLAVFVSVPALLLVVATVACWLPARRAARVEPMVALRTEN